MSSLVEEQGPFVVGRIQFKCPEKDEIIVGAELGDKEQSIPPLLLLLLRLEGDKRDSESYKYDNLLPIDVVPGPWFGRIEDAVSFRRTTTEMTETFSRAFPEDVVSSRKNSGTPLDVLHSRHESNHVNDLLLPAEGEKEQGGGEYIIDADEFWEGFDSDGDDFRDNTHEERQVIEESDEGRQRRMQEEEDRYWEMYDQTGAPSNGKETTAHRDDEERGVDINRIRNEPIKLMLKDAWRCMQEANAGLEGSKGVDGSDFLQLARDAVQEVKLETSG